jgi:beta-lysine 5,6-aminomutase alpha subunit
MPEIAAMGALERLDMMHNDVLYGIIFRDIKLSLRSSSTNALLS